MSRVLVWLQQWLPTHLISRLVGLVANCEWPLVSRPFIRVIQWAYDIDLSEAALTRSTSYPSFNAFFTRELAPHARPVSGAVCSPCDGTVSALGNIHDGHLLQAKGIDYRLGDLLGTGDDAAYREGSFITIYLAPSDYHRVHVPMAGHLERASYIPGRLFSVNAATTRWLPGLFPRNERLVCEFSDQAYALVMVGALIVAGIRPCWRDAVYPPGTLLQEKPALSFTQGDLLGQFEMGSTVILLFPERSDFTVAAGDRVRMGEPLVTHDHPQS